MGEGYSQQSDKSKYIIWPPKYILNVVLGPIIIKKKNSFHLIWNNNIIISHPSPQLSLNSSPIFFFTYTSPLHITLNHIPPTFFWSSSSLFLFNKYFLYNLTISASFFLKVPATQCNYLLWLKQWAKSQHLNFVNIFNSTHKEHMITLVKWSSATKMFIIHRNMTN